MAIVCTGKIGIGRIVVGVDCKTFPCNSAERIVGIGNGLTVTKRCGRRAVIAVVGIGGRPRGAVGGTGELTKVIIEVVLIRIRSEHGAGGIALSRACHTAACVVVLVIDRIAEGDILCGVQVAFPVIGIAIGDGIIEFDRNDPVEGVIHIRHNEAVAVGRAIQFSVLVIRIGGKRGTCATPCAPCDGRKASAELVIGQGILGGIVDADKGQAVVGIRIGDRGAGRRTFRMRYDAVAYFLNSRCVHSLYALRFVAVVGSIVAYLGDVWVFREGCLEADRS